MLDRLIHPSRIARLVLAWLAVVLITSPLQAFDCNRPPGSEDRSKILEQGFAASLPDLESALARVYDIKKSRSVSKDTSFYEWMDLWRLCDLMARSVETENLALARRHFFRRGQTGEIVLCVPGAEPPPDTTPLATSEVASLIASPEARQAIEKNLLPVGCELPSTGSLADIAGKPLAETLINNPDILRAFFSTSDAQDFSPLVLQNLREIYETHPSKWREYLNLALAIAVVNDSALPPWWPHQQVRPELVPRDVPPVATQFQRWVAANESARLLVDLRRFPASQLAFVVDAFLVPSEITWARQNIPFHVGVFGRAFSSIRYRDDRIKNKAFFWTASPYTFAAIRKTGGICIDQAYFAAYTAKALGLPAVLFNGQGSNGGHAWFGYMGSPNKWELDCGRDPAQNVVTGLALDPRTWRPVSDHGLRQLAASFRSSPAFLASTNDLAMASIFEKSGDSERSAAALENATRTCPQNPDAWSAWTAFLEKSRAPMPARIQAHEQAAFALARDADAKVTHQQALAALQRRSGNSGEAAATEHRILTQNLGSRPDLSCEAAAARVREALNTSGIDQAALVFHSQLRSIGKTGGGNFVKEVGLPFVSALLQNGQKSRALRTIDIMRQQFSPQPGSPLDLVLNEMTRECRKAKSSS